MIAIPKTRNSYELLENNEVKGTLTYKGMFNASADFHTTENGNHSLKWIFALITKKFRITQNDKETIKLKMNWKGDSTITMENGIEYKIISKGFFKRKYFIENQESKELIEILQKYNWKRWNYEYEIENCDIPQIDLLSLISIYALNYQQQYQMGIIMMCFGAIQFINVIANIQ